jgi:glucosamine--fructose-6-phosphate aminotransferase (isomerizing)
MCGITGLVGATATPLGDLLDCLENLEYRGYDSAGVAYLDDGLQVVKRAGDLDSLRDAVPDESVGVRVGIGHTRWSTHGPPTDENAHPHTDADGRVAVVHNGIIENHVALRRELREDGVTFTSETDSEVVPHLIARHLDAGRDPREAFEAAIDRLDGSYAVCAIVEGVDAVFTARRDSPLTVGRGDDTQYVASDVPAFLDHTRRVAYLDDGQSATVTADGYEAFDAEGDPTTVDERTVEWTAEQTRRDGFDHFMQKEIADQPAAVRRALRDRVTPDGVLTIERLAVSPDPAVVHFVGCGTSYHACLYGTRLFRRMGIPAVAHRASEYAITPPPHAGRGDGADGTELVVGITQSGETADVLRALESANDAGCETLALTNVLGSSAIREADDAYTIQAGPEVGVAATKTFTADLVALNLLAEYFTDRDHRETFRTLSNLPEWIETVVDGAGAETLAAEFVAADAVFFLGRGLDESVALEGALKLKEISYKHAEGFAAGELKHGPLALVTDDTPVVVLAGSAADPETYLERVVNQVAARDVPVAAVAPERVSVPDGCAHVLRVPDAPEPIVPILLNVHLQQLSYHVARRLGRPIDKPRHLAKSVTVR